MMIDLANRVAGLSDGEAVRIVESIARVRQFLVETPKPSASLKAALQQEFGAEPGGEVPSGGNVARAALLLLIEDPDYRPVIESRLEAAGQQRFAVGEIALTTAVLTILASSVDFEISKDKDGQTTWQFHYKKPNLKAAAKPLVDKLVSLLPG